MEKVELVKGDITKLAVDAIVNAANSSLLGGGGVDGAIHRAAGPQLLAECRTLGSCETGEAKITKGYQLPAKNVIHTVGPVWNATQPEEMARLLSNCYRNSLRLAADYGLKTVAFPNVSTGVYGYPKDQAAEVAIASVIKFLEKNESIETVTFVCFDDENYQIYHKKLSSSELGS